jgi:hypothetical protein
MTFPGGRGCFDVLSIFSVFQGVVSEELRGRRFPVRGERGDQGAQKLFEPSQEEAEVVAGGDRHRVDAIAVATY